jgi:hypothetical protein
VSANVALAAEPRLSRFRTAALLAARYPEVVFFAVLLAVPVLVQLASGAHANGMGGYPDEPGHFMSGLILRDFLLAGLPWPPLDWAHDYYAHHPTLGIGYWPPLFYIVEACWMLLFGFSRTSMLLFIAAICAVLQYLVFRFARKEFGTWPALFLAASLPLIPSVAWTNNLVMSDVFVAAMTFPATVAFGAFLDAPSRRNGVFFGLLAGLALLSKLSAVFLIFMVPLAIIVAGRFDMFRRPPLFIAGVTAGAIALPWFLGMRHLLSRGLLPSGLKHDVVVVWREYAELLYGTSGPLLLLLGAAGCVVVVIRRRVSPRWVPLAVQPLAVALLLSLAPVHLEARYAIVAFPSILLLAALGTRSLVRRFDLRSPQSALTLAVAIVCFSPVILAGPVRTATVNPSLRIAADRLARLAAPDSIFLVVSHRHEGAMVAELAAREPHRPGRRTFRASKVLAETDWNATYYRQWFTTRAEYAAALRQLRADFIMIDPLPESDIIPHHAQVWSVLNEGSEWEQIDSVDSGAENRCFIYRRTTDLSPGVN